MPEYRRFISYFYEYIEGKKQKNAGFAKVELRNGIWRILFRLTVNVHPRPPVEVFGFLRDQGRLMKVPMGTMRAGTEMAEEWAYRAGKPLWMEKYGLEDISGIWIQSGEGRCFATVWDDEPFDPGLFVKGSQRKEPETSLQKEADTESGMTAPKEEEMQLPETGKPVLKSGVTAPKEEGMHLSEVGKPISGSGVTVPKAEGMHLSETGKLIREPEELKEADPKTREPAGMIQETPAEAPGTIMAEEMRDMEREASEKLSENMDWRPGAEPKPQAEERKPQAEEPRPQAEEPGPQPKEEQEPQPEGAGPQPETGSGDRLPQGDADPAREDDGLWEELYQERMRFQPFDDQEISSCIRIIPGDVVRLQNAHWRTGRNSFLLHGYYNYRHLMIGRTADGDYVLGVPGIMNPQERYMASMFGFPDFKYSDEQDRNQNFGYWYRVLRRAADPDPQGNKY